MHFSLRDEVTWKNEVPWDEVPGNHNYFQKNEVALGVLVPSNISSKEKLKNNLHAHYIVSQSKIEDERKKKNNLKFALVTLLFDLNLC